MLDIKIRNVGPYKEISKDGIAFYGLLDETEAIQATCELISAAEDLLPLTQDEAACDLSVIREALEIS